MYQWENNIHSISIRNNNHQHKQQYKDALLEGDYWNHWDGCEGMHKEVGKLEGQKCLSPLKKTWPQQRAETQEGKKSQHFICFCWLALHVHCRDTTTWHLTHHAPHTRITVSNSVGPSWTLNYRFNQRLPAGIQNQLSVIIVSYFLISFYFILFRFDSLFSTNFSHSNFPDWICLFQFGF